MFDILQYIAIFYFVIWFVPVTPTSASPLPGLRRANWYIVTLQKRC